MGILDSLVVGVIASLVASATFFGLLLGMRPKVAVSGKISRLERDGTPGEFSYRFKLVNQTRRPMVDVQIRVYRDKSRKAPNSTIPIRVLKNLEVKSGQGGVIPGKRNGDQEARHARRIRLVGDLASLWPNDQEASILLRVTCRDGITGAFRQVEQRFLMHDCIVDGSFGFGDSLDVNPVRRLPATSPPQGQ